MDLQWIFKNEEHGGRSTAIILLTGTKGNIIPKSEGVLDVRD